MNIEIKRVENSFYMSNMYLLSCNEADYVWLVDCGDYFKVKSVLNGKKIKGVLLTHTHSDHVYGLNETLKDFPKTKIYTNDFGRLALGNAKLNLSKFHEEIPDFIIEQSANVQTLSAGDVVELFPDIYAKVVATPGHDKSCLSYIIEDYLFSGDSYIPGERLIALFPNSNKNEAKISYERLLELSKEYIICPGHGSNISKK